MLPDCFPHLLGFCPSPRLLGLSSHLSQLGRLPTSASISSGSIMTKLTLTRSSRGVLKLLRSLELPGSMAPIFAFCCVRACLHQDVANRHASGRLYATRICATEVFLSTHNPVAWPVSLVAGEVAWGGAVWHGKAVVPHPFQQHRSSDCHVLRGSPPCISDLRKHSFASSMMMALGSLAAASFSQLVRKPPASERVAFGGR